MSPPRPRLDAETKLARRQQALQRYSAKLVPQSVTGDVKILTSAFRHKKKLRTSAQQRMQRKPRVRKKPSTPAQQDAKRNSAKKYREKHRGKIQATDALRRAKKCIEQDGLEVLEERVQCPLIVKMQCKHEGRAPPPCPQTTIASNTARPVLDMEEWSSESEGSDDGDDAPIPGAVFYGFGQSRPRIRSPTPHQCDCRLPAYCPECAMVRLEHASGPGDRVYCVPSYFPHPNLTHTIAQHGEADDCHFFAVLSGQYAGIYSHFAQVQAILKIAPDTSYVSHQNWVGIMDNWRGYCAGQHEHNVRSSSPPSSPDSPPYSASAFDTSPCPSPRQSRTPSPNHHPFSNPFFDQPSGNSARKQPLKSPPSSPSKTKMRRTQAVASPSPSSGSRPLSSPMPAPAPATRSRRPPSSPTVPSSGSRTPSSPATPSASSRTARGGAVPWLPIPARLLPEMGSTRLRRSSPPQYEPTTLDEAGREGAGDGAGDAFTVRFYAVSICNRLLRSHERAFELLEATEGASMLLAHSIEEAAAFFDAADATARTLYAVRGHRIVFKNRESAFRLFLQDDDAQMLFGSSSAQVEMFISQHPWI
ncbi:hypothetical protein C8R44DRAFT_745310 [Mycena epipterygia]|nr:hypothetical protein C8R44DRAFT_745310 [Mycena epipterygia]